MPQAVPGSKVTPLMEMTSLSARYSLVPNGTNAAGWFGPAEPMKPTAPPDVEGRQWDFPAGANLIQQPRAYENISFLGLRALADAYDLIRLVIETRKDQMERLSWRIVPRRAKYGPGVTPPAALLKQCEDLEQFWRNPSADPQFASWAEWLRALLEDLFVIDAPALWYRRNRGGKLLSLEPIDGSTIIRRIDPWGRTPLPPFPAYQQYLKGMPAVNYTTRDLLYRPRNNRTWKMYGYSPVEQVLITVNIALRRQVFQLQYYTEGNVPEALIGVPETWTPDQIKAFQLYWDSVLEGNTAQRRHAKFVPGSAANAYVPTKEPELKNVFDEWLARVICFCFSIPPTPFVQQNNRATAQTAHKQSLEEGLEPLKFWVNNLVNFVDLVEFNAVDCEHVFDEDVEIDAATQAEIYREDAKAGVMTLDEVRAKKGDEPYPDGAGAKPMVLTTNGYVLVDINADAPSAGEMAEQRQTNTEAAMLQPKPGMDGSSDGSFDPKDEKKPPPKKKDDANKAAVAAGKRLVQHSQGDPSKKAEVKVRNLYREALSAAGLAAADAVRSALGKAAGKTPKAVADNVDLSSLADAAAQAAAALKAAAGDGGDTALVALGQDADNLFNQVNNAASDYARTRSADLVSEIDDTTREAIRSAIADGLDQGLTADEIANLVQDSTAFSPDRADLIAMTEIADANSAGALEGYSAAKENGVNVKKVWLLGEGACDICEENADAGAIALEDSFPSGDEAPTAHPNCRCSLGSVTEDDEE